MRILKSEAISRIFESVKYRDVSNGKQKQYHRLDEQIYLDFKKDKT